MTGAYVSMRAAVAILVAAVAVSAYILSPSTGYTFATGDFNLKIDSKASWNGKPQDGTNGTYDSTWYLKNLVPWVDRFFYLDDVKPGDQGEATISFHVNKDAWICLDFENLKEYENGENEPESLVDTGPDNSAELADGVEFFSWYDDKKTGGAYRGDNIFQKGEKPIFGAVEGKQAATTTLNNKTYALADAVAGEPFKAGKTAYIGIQWCAGDMHVDVANGIITCDGTALGNEAQTDSFKVDVGFRAVPSKDKKNFTCIKKNTQCEWPSCNGKCNTNIKVDNNGIIISNTTSSSNTGGNSAGGSQGGSGGAGGSGGSGGSGGTVNTGNASSSANSTNIVNLIRILFGR